MAQRRTTKAKEKPQYTCKDCKESYDWHNKGANGTMILCSCKYFKYCRFLNLDYCDHFIHK